MSWIRLQKVMADAGIDSRRGSEALIRAGRVRVDGRPAILGESVDPESQVVEVDGRPLPAMDELQALASRAVRPASDLAGSAAFRRYQAGVVVALALRDALGQKRRRS